jgi:hypothetical protein
MLVGEGVLVDIHPVPPAEQVEAEGRTLGRLDEGELFADIAEAERLLAESGLYLLEEEVETDIVERFDNVEEMIENVSDRARMRLPPKLERRVRAARPPIDLRERIVLRRFRAT